MHKNMISIFVASCRFISSA